MAFLQDPVLFTKFSFGSGAWSPPGFSLIASFGSLSLFFRHYSFPGIFSVFPFFTDTEDGVAYCLI